MEAWLGRGRAELGESKGDKTESLLTGLGQVLQGPAVQHSTSQLPDNTSPQHMLAENWILINMNSVINQHKHLSER